jgi:predicted DNA-binding transcriptional regulator YafY
LLIHDEARRTSAAMQGKPMKTEVTFTYKNYRGETSVRLVRPIMVSFGTTGFHSEPQWLLHGWDLNKDAERTFAMKDIKDWEPS